MSDDVVKPIDAAISQIKSTYTPGKGRPVEDIDDQPIQTVETTESAAPPADDLIWPPPGLESIHGDLARITSQFAVAVLILLLPLIFGVMGDNHAAGSWGSVVVFMIDFVLLAFAFVGLRQLLVNALMAIESGYPRSLIWHVAADTQRDIPLILQGRGYFADTPRDVATRLLSLRTTSVTCALLGVLWVPVSFPFVAIGAANGVLRGPLFWIALLAPTVLLIGLAAHFRIKEASAKASVRSREAVDRERAAQVSGWSQVYSRVGLTRSRSKNTIELKLATGAVWMALFLMLIPIVLAGITTAVPDFIVRNSGGYLTSARVQMLSVFRKYQLPPDSSISPLAAGEAFHNIRFIGKAHDGNAVQKQPTRDYARSVIPSSTSMFIRQRDSWPDSLLHHLRRGVSAEDRIMLDSAAQHPAHAEMAIIARAPSIDIASARWDFEIADTVPAYMLPYGMGELNDLTVAHAARAALQYQNGDVRGAEITIKEIISAGFNLQDNSISLIDDLIAARVTRLGMAALASLYEVTGRATEAAHIRGSLAAIERIEGGSRRSSSIEELKRAVITKTLTRGGRWETFALLQTAAPCMNLSNALFGAQRDEVWMERARENLVRLPGEAKYFELLKRGVTMRSSKGTERCSPRVLRSYWRAARNFY